MSWYTVSGKPFDSFLQAVGEARKSNTAVIETATGMTRWTPAPPVSKKRMRQYREHQAAYQAQQQAKA